MKTLLISTGNGMFGKALAQQLIDRPDVRIRLMVRDTSKHTLTGSNVEVVQGDMDDPASLVGPTTGITHAFVTSPMDEHITSRETAVVDACKANGNPHIINIYGAVRHQGDELDKLHLAAIDHLKKSGLPWTLVSPNSVMETSLLPLKFQVASGSIYGMTGDGKVGFVALSDVADVMAQVVMTDGHDQQNYECTGPAALSLADVVQELAKELDKPLQYINMTEDDYANMLLQAGWFPDRQSLDINVLCHFRAWLEGRASLVTNTVQEVTGQPAKSVAAWLHEHRDVFVDATNASAQ